MARDMTSAMQTAIANERGSIAHLFEIDSSGGTVRFATTPTDISWNGHTWTAVGGALSFDAITEQGEDQSGHGTYLTLSGVDRTIVSVVLSNYMRGREAVIYLVHFDSSWGIVADPLELYRGFLNSSFRINEHRDTEGLRAGTVTITTRIVSRLDALGQPCTTRANVQSHRDMLRRAGLTGTDLDDTFFKHVPELVNKPVYWGRNAPAEASQANGGTTGPGGGEQAQ